MENTSNIVKKIEIKDNKFTMKDLRTLVLLVVFVVLPIRFFVAQPFIVSGQSMDPTFHDGQYLIVDQLSYNFNSPARGDIVIFRYAGDTSKFFIKRIVGLPGETVKIIGNKIFIKKDGQEFSELKEEYITEIFNANNEWKIDSDEIFVMGDNRNNSLDSRYFGPIKTNSVIGRAYLRLFPLSEIDYLPGKF